MKRSSEGSQLIQIQTNYEFKKIKLSKNQNKIFCRKNVLQHFISSQDVENCNANELLELYVLQKQFSEERESVLRLFVLNLYTKTYLTSHRDLGKVIDEILLLINEERSSKVICQGLNSLYKVGSCKNISKQHLIKVKNFAQGRLCGSYNVQRYALLLLGSFIDIYSKENTALKLICMYTDSPDPRVRSQAFNSMLNFSKQGFFLPTQFFERCCVGLKDDDEYVRKEALLLIFEVATRNPEAIIKATDTKGSGRLVDAAFEKVCCALCDFSLHVRIRAATLLGKMTQVSQEYLHQTLDKKLMNNLKRRKSIHQRDLDNYMSGEWFSSKKRIYDVAKEPIEANSVLLITSGACGALVHGLEDEFAEVRSASVDAVCKLALFNPDFAVQCLDFLVDMFNDEIEDIRLKAIYSLTAISNHIVLREDQLEMMLSSLEDNSVEVREGLHLMFGACKVSTQSCLLMVVNKILSVLSLYAEDKISAYNCMQKIGKQHSEICMTLLPQLLTNHPCFDYPEKDVEDPSYICIIIMLFNAAVYKTPMINLFPDVTISHYFYLRDTMPKLVPHLHIEGIASSISNERITGSQIFLKHIAGNINEFCRFSPARSSFITDTLEKLTRLAQIDYLMSSAISFTATFLKAQSLIDQLRNCVLNCNKITPSKISLCHLMTNCSKLQNIFSGLSNSDMMHVKEISLRASAVHLILVVRDGSQSALSSCQLLLRIASDFKSFLGHDTRNKPDIWTTKLLSKLSNIEDPKPGKVFRAICSILKCASPIQTPQFNINIKMCKATIIEPESNRSTENVVKVTAGLISALNLVAEIENLEKHQLENLRLKLKYPDQNVHMVSPRSSDLKFVSNEMGRENEHNWRLRTTVLLSHGVWSESCYVEITLCLFVRPIELELSKPIKIIFSPKPVRRGF